MSSRNPIARHQRRIIRNSQGRVEALNAQLRREGKPPLTDEDVALVRADAARAVLAEVHPPETRTVADRRAKRARRHEGVKAILAKAGVR